MKYIFSSCDEKYFIDHGYHFINSANKQGVEPWVDIISPNPTAFIESELYKFSGDTHTQSILLSSNISFTESNQTNRTFYACNRFFKFSDILQKSDGLLITDIDCFLRKPIDWEDFSDADYSLYLRAPLPGTIGWLNTGTHVGAGAIYLTQKAIGFIELVKKKIERYGLFWFVDQVALWEAHKYFRSNDLGLRFKEMPQKYIDWEFTEEGVIWTGKGPRKTQKNYLKERDRAS